ncbi:CHAT domain-containing protein [Kamptonema animale]|nr:CHAT domain-containing protein [Kamptonema animale]
MASFYQGRLQKGLLPAVVLIATQWAMLQPEKWHSTYYWAAFTVPGEW